MRGEAGFSSSAWRALLGLGGKTREYCIDASLPGIVEDPMRVVLFVFPAGSCSERPLYTVRGGDPMDAGALLSSIVEACSTASSRVDSLRRAALPSPFDLALLRKPRREEVEYVEARNAKLLCEQLFEGHKPVLRSSRPSFINYSFGRGIEWRRLVLLARIDGGVRAYLEKLGARIA